MRIAKILVSSAAAAVMSTVAFAAHAQTVDSGAVNWTGFYAGVNAGGDYNGVTRFDRTTGSAANNQTALTLGLRPTDYAVHTNGFTGGLQAGYNYQLGNNYGFGGAHFVVGAEADFDYTGIHQTDTLSNTTLYGPLDTLGTTPYTRVNQYHGDLRYLGTVRGRAGVAFGNALIYGTGGFAYGQADSRATFYGPNAPTTPFFTGDTNGVKPGYVYGGGVEYAVPTGSFLSRLNVAHASAITLRAEYIRYDLGTETFAMPGVNGGATIGSYTARVRTDGNIVRAGINYKF
jgi:outer membrane immunogenic protein